VTTTLYRTFVKVYHCGSSTEIKVKSNKTFIGTNDTAHLEGLKIALEGARNVIIRNITFSKVLGDDLMELNAGSKNIWIDHCEFYTDRDHDDNEDYYDGMLDIKNESSFITVRGAISMIITKVSW